LMSYDLETGLFTRLRRLSNNAKEGTTTAGCINKHIGYRVFNICGRVHYAHRLAWLYMIGEWPALAIDHVNGDKSDNRFCNLRLSTNQQNLWNRDKLATNTSGHRGVAKSNAGKPWRAFVTVNKRYVSLGQFDTFEAAVAARLDGERRYYGEFAKCASL
jgi:hypothetical protein